MTPIQFFEKYCMGDIELWLGHFCKDEEVDLEAILKKHVMEDIWDMEIHGNTCFKDWDSKQIRELAHALNGVLDFMEKGNVEITASATLQGAKNTSVS